MDRKARLRTRDELLHAARQRVLLMGILNTTPDSFSDGGEYSAMDAALAHSVKMTAEGAAIIDVGGESTRPGAESVPEDEERRRTIGLIRTLANETAAPVSIDTYKAAIARDAVAAGAVLVNDVWGMTRDPQMADVVATSESAVVVTYNRGQTDETTNIVDDMSGFFNQVFDMANTAGIPKDHIWLDPGVGFSKTLQQNVEVLSRLDVLIEFGCPVLVGLSRKSLIGLTLNRDVGDRLAGTIGAHLAAVLSGARILRVHDVREHADALTMFELTKAKSDG